MKILAIRLKNLASLAGPFELDFTAEPLASAGLFAITGPTGAGKSTLLDALCLALFGAVPRLNNIGRETKVPEVEGEISTSDPRTLLRRGTGSGFAEVDFVGIDGHRYRARWEANRARDKATGKLQGSKQSLHDLDSNQLLSNQSKSEYKQLIEAKLGLNFDQFTRAVMLAQSEFSAFLKADDKDRSELLEKLTNTAIYSQLGRRAFVKSREAEDAYKALNAQAEGITPLAPEARLELDQHFDQAQQTLKGQQARLKQLEQQQQWLTELHQLQAQHRQAAEAVQQARQEWEGLGAERLRLTQLEQLAPQRHQFARQAELQAQLTPLAAQILQQQEQLTDHQTREALLEQTKSAAQAALLGAQQQQSEAAPRLRQAFDAQSELARLDAQLQRSAELKQHAEAQCTEGQAHLQRLLEQQQRVAEQLERLSTELEQSAALAPLTQAWTLHRERLQQLLKIGSRLRTGETELPALQARASASAQALAEQREALEILYREAVAEPEAVSEQIETLGSLLNDNRRQQRSFEDLERLWKTRHALDQQLLALQNKQQLVQEQREQLNREGLQTKEALAVAEQTLDVTRQVLERQRLARSASVEELRGQLQDDQPCPVCGSQEHPYHQPEALLQSLARHDESEEASARQQVDELKEKLAQLRERVGGLIAQQKEFLLQQDQLLSEQNALTPSQDAHPLYPQLLDQPPEQRDAWLSLRLGQLQHSIGQDEQRQSALLTLQKEAARLQQQVQSALEASQTSARQLAEQQQKMAADRQRFEEELTVFAALLPAPVLDGLRHDTSATFLQLDQQIAQRLTQLDQQRDELQEHAERQKVLDQQQFEQLNRDKAFTEAQQHVTALSGQRQTCAQALTELLGEHRSAEHWQQHLEQAVEQSRQAETTATQTLQELRSLMIQLSAELKASQERQQLLEEESRELDTRLSEWRIRHSELDDAGLHQLLTWDDAQVAELRQRLHNSEKAIEQGQVLLQERERTLAQHQALHAETPDAEQLAAALGELQTQLGASEQQCAELRARQAEDQRRQNANQQLQQQIAEAYGNYQRWARLNDLIGSSTGDKFRKIAQAYNLDLLVHHANTQLKQLVRRYRLKRGGSMLGLLVQDTEMGDELRSVHSLSGGETFLVSLALALGLASMASSTLKIESLFIDEGFGSLDPESLQLAMDALDGLQAQGRKVGVISHVQEMHERIPVQIQVRRQGNGLSTLEVK